MYPYPEETRRRLKQLAADLKERIYPMRMPVERLRVSGPHGRISYSEAQTLRRFKQAKPGMQLGPTWSTFWFRGAVRVPEAWHGKRVDLLWHAHSCESTLWVEGKSVQGLNWNFAYRPDAVLAYTAQAGQELKFQVELACNHAFGASRPDTFALSNVSPHVLDRCEIAAFDDFAWEIYYDFSVLQELEASIAQNGSAEEKALGGELLRELNDFANMYRADARETWGVSQDILRRLYRRFSATSLHHVCAIGHAHIDCAWLWPVAETLRKCERTFSSQTTYMQQYPGYKFACSQAFQYDAIKQRNPELYARIKEAAARGQWIPVGGTWVEPDCNLPSGESLARQFLYGQRFFEQEFGARCTEFWNPDVFGYNGQLPQIMQESGISRFLTQKLSWNRFNKPRHHSFIWEGIDGSRVLTHFPPADTYGSVPSPADLRDAVGRYKDHERSGHSLYLFGYGDGGGGPTKPMLEVLRRCADLAGVPPTVVRGPGEFFDLLEADAHRLPRIIGELYFEYHRGTYTTQAATKRQVRKLEFLLHDVEFLSAVACRLGTLEYPRSELDRLWKLLLLNQFHDILPGSSIGEVYTTAQQELADIGRHAQRLRAAALDALSLSAEPVPVNTLGVARSEVTETPSGKLAFVEAPAYGIGVTSPRPSPPFALHDTASKAILLENAHLRALVSESGDLLSLIDKHSKRDALSDRGNRLQLFEDKPTEYDAWEVEPYHLETGHECPAAHTVRCQVNDLRAEVVFERSIGEHSRMQQTIRLDAGAARLEFHCDVEWREEHKLLKVCFPVAVRAMNATYEMQFGYVERPTHFNTTYDLARFEVPGHKWADLSEHGFGVALLSESKYGFSTFDNEMRMTLLRSPKDPDPQADMGRHRFAYALYPHAGTLQSGGVVAEALRFNHPLVWSDSQPSPQQHTPNSYVSMPAQSFVSVEDENLILDTVKLAEDSDALVLRFYEAHGARGNARVRVSLPFAQAFLANILEDVGDALPVAGDAIEIAYEPFKIITVMLR